VLEPQPRPDGLSLRVDWVHLVSHAHQHPVCMSAGLGDDHEADDHEARAGNTAGNTGAASIFVMLDAARPRLRPGDRVLLIVPESARFTLAFAQLTCVEPKACSSRAELAQSPLPKPGAEDPAPVTRAFEELAEVWAELQRALARIPIIRAGRPDPVDLLGTMFVIEGLGTRKAATWANRLAESLGLTDDQLSFLRYHGVNDDGHFQMLTAALRSGMLDDAARVTARLYALQLEELDHV
jgi:hypothetical protein